MTHAVTITFTVDGSEKQVDKLVDRALTVIEASKRLVPDEHGATVSVEVGAAP